MIGIFHGRGITERAKAHAQIDVELRQHLHEFNNGKNLNALGIFMCIALHANKDGWAWPSRELMKKETGISTNNSLSSALRHLRQVRINGQRIFAHYRVKHENGQYGQSAYLIFPDLPHGPGPRGDLAEFNPYMGDPCTDDPYMDDPYHQEQPSPQGNPPKQQPDGAGEDAAPVAAGKSESAGMPPQDIGFGDNTGAVTGWPDGTDKADMLAIQTSEPYELLNLTGISRGSKLKLAVKCTVDEIVAAAFYWMHRQVEESITDTHLRGQFVNHLSDGSHTPNRFRLLASVSWHVVRDVVMCVRAAQQHPRRETAPVAFVAGLEGEVIECFLEFATRGPRLDEPELHYAWRGDSPFWPVLEWWIGDAATGDVEAWLAERMVKREE